MFRKVKRLTEEVEKLRVASGYDARSIKELREVVAKRKKENDQNKRKCALLAAKVKRLEDKIYDMQISYEKEMEVIREGLKPYMGFDWEETKKKGILKDEK